jgi:alkylation response protein AidB-like acyl-CoA dehydrogenase
MIDDDIRQLRDSADRLFADQGGVPALRRCRDQRDFDGAATGAWQDIAGLGLAGVLVPETFDGSGLGFRASTQIAESMGRALARGPFLSSAVMATTALRLSDNDALKAEYLPQIAAGSCIIAVAGEEQARHRPLAIDMVARSDGAGFRLTGRKIGVIDGNIASNLIVVAVDAEDRTQLRILLVDAASLGIRVVSDLGLDSQPAAAVEFDDVCVSANRLLCTPGQARELLDRVYDAGRLHLAAEMLGLAQESFDRTLDYLKTRVQFGRLIGEFQALQHRAAILFGELEIASSIVLKAASAWDANDSDAPALTSLAKARVGEIAKHVTTEAVQLHGGIGVTDDFDIGFFLKRARVASERLGDTAFHAERYAGLRGL